MRDKLDRAHAKEREAFGKKLHDFGQIQAHIAQSYAEYMAGKSYLYQVPGSILCCPVGLCILHTVGLCNLHTGRRRCISTSSTRAP